MRFLRLVLHCVVFVISLAPLLVTSTAEASQEVTTVPMPALLAKSWLIGYALVFLCILLGLLAALLSSRRKTLRKKE